MKKLTTFFMALLLLFCVMPTQSKAASFKDVQTSIYYYEAVEWGYQKKIIAGDGTGYFRPTDPVTHGQFIKMFTEFYNFPVTYDKSLPLYEEYYRALSQYGIKFHAVNKNEPITRGEIAALIMLTQNAYSHVTGNYNYANVKLDDEKIAQFMFDQQLSNGVTTANVPPAKKYGFDSKLTRGDAMQFLYNLHKKQVDSLKMTKDTASTQLANVKTLQAKNGVTYKAFKDDFKNYSGVFEYKGIVIGGYESKYGKTFEGYLIGKPLPAEYLIENNTKRFTFITDQHANDIVHAIYWESQNLAHLDLLYNALKNTPENQDFLNALYTELINEFRVKHGQTTLITHPALQKAAVLHSTDMMKNNYFDHTSLTGLEPWDRIQAIDSSFNGMGENISAGYYNIFDSHEGWINSFGHRQNMLNKYTHVGFGSASGGGYYDRYYTVNLGFIR